MSSAGDSSGASAHPLPPPRNDSTSSFASTETSSVGGQSTGSSASAKQDRKAAKEAERLRRKQDKELAKQHKRELEAAKKQQKADAKVRIAEAKAALRMGKAGSSKLSQSTSAASGGPRARKGSGASSRSGSRKAAPGAKTPEDADVPVNAAAGAPERADAEPMDDALMMSMKLGVMSMQERRKPAVGRDGAAGPGSGPGASADDRMKFVQSWKDRTFRQEEATRAAQEGKSPRKQHRRAHAGHRASSRRRRGDFCSSSSSSASSSSRRQRRSERGSGPSCESLVTGDSMAGGDAVAAT